MVTGLLIPMLTRYVRNSAVSEESPSPFASVRENRSARETISAALLISAFKSVNATSSVLCVCRELA